MHRPAAVRLEAIVVLEIVDEQLAGGQQMEFAVCGYCDELRTRETENE